MIRSAAEIVREYGPFPGVDSVDGVTYDGQHVWFASGVKPPGLTSACINRRQASAAISKIRPTGVACELGGGMGGLRSAHPASCSDCLGEPCCLRVINTACYCSLSYSFNGFIDGEKRDKKPFSRNDRLPEPVSYFDV